MPNLYRNEDTGHWYMELDQIRIVFEETLHGLEAVGWYRPGGGKKEYSNDPYARIAREMLE